MCVQTKGSRHNLSEREASQLDLLLESDDVSSVRPYNEKQMQACVDQAKLIYKKVKPAPIKLKQALFTDGVEDQFYSELAYEKQKKKHNLDLPELQRILDKITKVLFQ